MMRVEQFLSFAEGLWPWRHAKYKQMCALAATGQLGGSQMAELSGHVANCSECRLFLEGVSQLSVQVMPLLAEAHGVGSDGSVPSGMRDRFLTRLAFESAHHEKMLRADSFAPPKPLVLTPFERLNPDKATERTPEKALAKLNDAKEATAANPRVRVPALVWGLTASVAFCAVVGFFAFRAGQTQSGKPLDPFPRVAPTAVSPAPTSTPAAGDSERVAALESQTAELRLELAKVRDELLRSQGEKRSLADNLMALQAQLAAASNTSLSGTRNASDAPQVNAAQLASLQEQLDRVTRRLAESDIKFTAEKQAGDELAAKLDAAQSELQRERDLKSAKLEMGDIVAARNLHIVDVYDADTSGKRQRSFGRVFYIENKSLVFYAYDLDAPREFRKTVTFHVWGGKAGVSSVSRSLGILHKDDDGQGRWAMTFDDPAVLAQINSVFVTAESGDRQVDAPHGKKVLYAYFGNKPNHP
jgi:hypothetical protein